jgi:prepilin-type processing-associated H-X9-DG protein
MGFVNRVGTSQFIAYVERDADAIANDLVFAGDPRQDDFDIWLDIMNFSPWIAKTRHNFVANYLYLDGHVVSLNWQPSDLTSPVAIGLYPDSMGDPIAPIRYSVQGFYATETSPDPWAEP